jgi:septum formation protein
MLLTEARIPFRTIPQDMDESQCALGLSFTDKVYHIALHKMDHVILPVGNKKDEYCFVLTADTMVCDASGTIHGKPIDREDAIKKIKGARNGSTACTAFCLDKKIWNGHVWVTQIRIAQYVTVNYVFDVPDTWIDIYLDTTIGQQCAGGAAVEGFGSQFLRSVNGSHSALIGLPLYEVREALEQLGFF